VPILEVMFGRDTIQVDDESILMGMFKRSKDFLNIKDYRWIRDTMTSYQVKNKNGNPV
jgi:hypothetical protein